MSFSINCTFLQIKMIESERWTGGVNEEYETQHFGFGAQRLKIAMRQMIEQKIRIGIKNMDSYLQGSLELNDTDKATLTRCCDKLISLYCERVGPSLKIIDSEVEKLLTIPSNVVLPEDEVQVGQSSNCSPEILKEEVAMLRKRVERGALMTALLTAEEEELSTLDKVCDTANKDMEALDILYKSYEKNSNVKSILNKIEFICASVPSMKSFIVDVFDE